MTATLDDLRQVAIDYRRSLHEAWGIRVREEREAALRSVHDRFAGRMPVNGVGVTVIVPENRTIHRRPHYRFVYVVDGRRSSEAIARARLAEGV